MTKSRLSTPYLTAIIIGVLYGVVCQFAIRLKKLQFLYGVMSFGFVFVLPFVLGFLALWCASQEQRKSWKFRIFAPLGSTVVCLVVSLLVGWEGAICLVMAGLVYFPLASLGGILSGLILARVDSRRLNSGWLVGVLSLPFVSAYMEHYFELPSQIRAVETRISIAAPAAAVWQQIVRVPLITEPLDGVFYRMGFPKPLEATLSYDGVGGVREASFERGLVFVETVDVWEPERKLSFSIKSAPNSVPPTTLDEHVVVGGRYFDVLRGTYQIVSISDTQSDLILSSEVRVSTRFNFYADMWARFLMSDIQNTILQVIRTRSENLGRKS